MAGDGEAYCAAAAVVVPAATPAPQQAHLGGVVACKAAQLVDVPLRLIDFVPHFKGVVVCPIPAGTSK